MKKLIEIPSAPLDFQTIQDQVTEHTALLRKQLLWTDAVSAWAEQHRIHTPDKKVVLRSLGPITKAMPPEVLAMGNVTLTESRNGLELDMDCFQGSNVNSGFTIYPSTNERGGPVGRIHFLDAPRKREYIEQQIKINDTSLLTLSEDVCLYNEAVADLQECQRKLKAIKLPEISSVVSREMPLTGYLDFIKGYAE